MIDRVTYNGRSELAEAKILNMSVAKYFGLVKEYAEILRDTKKLNEKVLGSGSLYEIPESGSIRCRLKWAVSSLSILMITTFPFPSFIV